MQFFVGLHQPYHAQHFERCMVSVATLRKRKSDFVVRDWMLDSGAFSEITRHGGYRSTPDEYAAHIERWASCGNLLCAVAQDYMCEEHVLAITGLTIPDHQRLTIERYDALCELVSGVYILPVLQGYAPDDYRRHLDAYGNRLECNAWVGVGSVCKRNKSPNAIREVLQSIRNERPDLRLHGFGVKLTALSQPDICAEFHSADSMAWSFAARRDGRGPDANRWQEAMKYVQKVHERTAA